MKNNLPEVWLRGPLDNVPTLLQPVAHALLQAREELNELMHDFPDDKLWLSVAAMASPGFHLQHLTGVLDRLLTYARGELLSDEQLRYLQSEGKDQSRSVEQLVDSFKKQVDIALAQITSTDETILTNVRGVGRAQIPSTVIGLLTHSAEHTMRHLGQLIVTVAVLRQQ
ncbi:DinB family protein [Mucilaginibacter myungsuensis]|uniref:DinB family protein n=1 Tax=Mucilaginibacter myungsuensis TaxID=649104 RepID=A0A929KSI6_9SPHI|nr:DinB family protein [Mucilaginibacter myungsuensis]MBE9660372.1 DinB family protein [Mucilaginibacter myungsuensis]MDN3600414.1 DinB family protein [Mucilaginibacter myungsuensis]